MTSPVPNLYVHVPFCAHKCDYCAFYSHIPKTGVVDRYVQALISELQLVAPRLQPRTIFFGGGTPSILTLQQWDRIFSAFHRLNLVPSAEWTVECNPASLSLEKARLLRAGGVNRISMGVQSLDPSLLERLGRVHTREMVFKSYDLLREAGFANVNLDLMFGIPGQTMKIWEETLQEIVRLQSEHLSCYEVIYEEDTALFQQLAAGEFSVDEGLTADMFEKLADFAGESGFQQYEVANFAKDLAKQPPDSGTDLTFIPSQACQHNINYWRGGSFFGLGPGAAEYIDGERLKNWSNTEFYCERLAEGKRPTETREKLSDKGRAGEIAAFGLRMNAGWPLDEFSRRTGYDLVQTWKPAVDRLTELRYALLEGNRFRLTREGLRYADWAAEQFIE